MRNYHSWYEMLSNEAKTNGEDVDQLICTLSQEELHVKFDCGYGGTNGEPFTAWGPEWVYFPICYDGAEWVGSAPRNPCDIKTGHMGGG